MRRGGEGVGVRARLVGAACRDHPDPVVARSRSGTPDGGPDHLDDGHVVALAGVVENGGAGGVAGDDQGLDTALDQPVEALERELAGLGDGTRAVGLAGGVGEVDHRLVGQLVEHGSSDGESAIARVEDPDRCVSHAISVWAGAVRARTDGASRPSQRVGPGEWIAPGGRRPMPSRERVSA